MPVALWGCCSPKFCWHFAIRCKSICKRNELQHFRHVQFSFNIWLFISCCWWCLLLQSSQLALAVAPRLCKWFLEGKLISWFAYSKRKKKKSCLFVALRHTSLFFSIGLLRICTFRDCTISLCHSYICRVHNRMRSRLKVAHVLLWMLLLRCLLLLVTHILQLEAALWAPHEWRVLCFSEARWT